MFWVSMNIPKISVINKNFDSIKPQWKNFQENDSRKVFLDFPVKHDVFGTCMVSIKNFEEYFNRWIIELKNTSGKIFGKEVISIDKDNKKMIGFNIIVEPEYRKKFHFGELLRLASIMEMKENKSPLIDIYSKDTAVYFHSKYKFLPKITSFEERDKALETIVGDKAETFVDLAERAKEIQKTVEVNRKNAQKQRELCKETNVLVTEYIQRALQEKNPEKNHPFLRGMEMELTEKSVQENKDFFNSLFEKHGIDYRI